MPANKEDRKPLKHTEAQPLVRRKRLCTPTVAWLDSRKCCMYMPSASTVVVTIPHLRFTGTMDQQSMEVLERRAAVEAFTRSMCDPPPMARPRDTGCDLRLARRPRDPGAALWSEAAGKQHPARLRGNGTSETRRGREVHLCFGAATNGTLGSQSWEKAWQIKRKAGQPCCS